MNSPQTDPAIALARKCVAIARLSIGLLVMSLVIANAITSFADANFFDGSDASLKVEVAQFLNALLLPLGLFTALLLLSVFASVHVERLASGNQQSGTRDLPAGEGQQETSADDSIWRR